MTFLIILIIGLASFPIIINANLSLGRINGGEYVLNNSTTNGIIVYNKSCSECLCLTFIFNQTEGFQGLNCYPSNKTCTLLKNVSSRSQIRINTYSLFYFLRTAINFSTTGK